MLTSKSPGSVLNGLLDVNIIRFDTLILHWHYFTVVDLARYLWYVINIGSLRVRSAKGARRMCAVPDYSCQAKLDEPIFIPRIFVLTEPLDNFMLS